MKIQSTMLQVCSVILLFSAVSLGQNADTLQRPPGKWSYTYSPISGRGFSDAPVKILSVSGNIKNVGTISAIGVQNNTSQIVVGVKFGWVIYRKETPTDILAKGETPVLGLGDLAPNEKRQLTYPVVSFGKQLPLLMKDGELNGEFVIEIVINEIHFDDETKWERK